MADLNEALNYMADGKLLPVTDIWNRELEYMADGKLLSMMSANRIALSIGCVAYWKFDVDSATQIDSVNSHDGTVANAVYNGSGKINGAFDYDGNGDVITVPDHADLRPDSHDFTISAWVKLDATITPDWCSIFGKGDTGAGEWMVRVPKSTGVVQAYGDNANMSFGMDESPIVDTNWHHVVLVIDQSNTNAYLYLDGVRCASPEPSPGTFGSTKDLTIGGADGNATRWWDGGIDEIGIWNRALEQADIDELYNGGTGIQYPFLPAAGWANNFLGVANASIAKINGIAIASISKVNGT